MNIIGLGQCGCNIAKCFEQYPQYDVYYINTEKQKSKNFFLIPEQKTHEEYEKNCPDLSKFFKKIKDDVLFVLGGSGALSGVCLRILEYLKHCNISIVYIKPEMALLSSVGTLHERVVYNILQEYTRSGVLKDMHIFSNSELEKFIPDITILNQHDRLNEVISFSLHMMNVFNNTKPVISTTSEFSDIARIGAMGSFDIEENLENFYFSLDNVSEKCYYYAIPEKQLKEDTKLFRKIKNQMKEKTEDGEIKVSYMIHITEHQQILCYILARSSQIQK